MSSGNMGSFIRTANLAFNTVARASRSSRRGYMVLSDLCDSTEVASENFQAGTALQAAHEALCAQVSERAVSSPHFKSLGDGIMIEVGTAVEACRIALKLVQASKELRTHAEENLVRPEFQDFALKVVVASDEFFPAPDTQRWLGLLPTKVARLASYAQRDQVWIDSLVSEVIEPYLPDLRREFGGKLMRGATFNVPLKGFREPCRIDELCLGVEPAGAKTSIPGEELRLSWPDVIDATKWLVHKIRQSEFQPDHVVAVGRSGVILGGIIAAELATDGRHVPVHVCDQTQSSHGEGKVISTLTEPPATYGGKGLSESKHVPTPAWSPGPVLLVIGQADTVETFDSTRAWLEERGITQIRTLALVSGESARPDFWRFKAQHPLLPWHFASASDSPVLTRPRSARAAAE